MKNNQEANKIRMRLKCDQFCEYVQKHISMAKKKSYACYKAGLYDYLQGKLKFI